MIRSWATAQILRKTVLSLLKRVYELNVRLQKNTFNSWWKELFLKAKLKFTHWSSCLNFLTIYVVKCPIVNHSRILSENRHLHNVNAKITRLADFTTALQIIVLSCNLLHLILSKDKSTSSSGLIKVGDDDVITSLVTSRKRYTFAYPTGAT